MATIRENPTSLNESTLETNIASEIASLFDSSFNLGYPFRLRYLFEFKRVNFRIFDRRKTKLYRLTPIEENKGGGWDTKIVVPVKKNERRAIFIQFKRGNHSEGNHILNSLFNLKKHNPNKNAEFKFNDNSNNNQHQTLKNLSDSLVTKGLSSNAVMYAFPRITDLKQFEELDEDLLLHTTFLTIPEIDKEANAQNANLYDGKEHYFRTCYYDETKREISSTPFQLKENNLENILYEIILVKISHFRNQYGEEIPIKLLNDEILIMLSDYLRINPFQIREFEFYHRNFESRDLNSYFKKVVNSRNENFNNLYGQNQNENQFEWRENLFLRISEFLKNKLSKKISIQEEVPSDYTLNLTNDEYVFQLSENSETSLLVF